jgi:hypothetical protein
MTTIARQNFYLYPIWEIEGEKIRNSEIWLNLNKAWIFIGWSLANFVFVLIGNPRCLSSQDKLNIGPYGGIFWNYSDLNPMNNLVANLVLCLA